MAYRDLSTDIGCLFINITISFKSFSYLFLITCIELQKTATGHFLFRGLLSRTPSAYTGELPETQPNRHEVRGGFPFPF